MDLALVADKGGVGKSTLAYHVAVRLRQLGADVGLIDLDRRSACSTWIQAAAEPFFPAYSLDAVVGSLPNHPARVWDTPAHPSGELRASLARACDLLVVVAQTDLDSQSAAAELCHKLRDEGARTAILINGVHPCAATGRESVEALRRAELPCLDGYVRRYACYERARWDGRAVCDYPYPSADQAWSDICQATDEMLLLLGGNHASRAA